LLNDDRIQGSDWFENRISKIFRPPTLSTPKPPMDSRRTIRCRKPFPFPSPVLRTPRAVPAEDHENHHLPITKRTISTFGVRRKEWGCLLLRLLVLGCSLLDRDLSPSTVPETSPAAQHHPLALPPVVDTDWFVRPVSPGEPPWWRVVYEELSDQAPCGLLRRTWSLSCDRRMLGGRIRPYCDTDVLLVCVRRRSGCSCSKASLHFVFEG
jgi:hypothetical protein